MLLSARSFDELHQGLPSINVEVPSRLARRGNSPEINSIVRLLGSIPFSPSDFPLHLSKTERPDFVLKLGNRSIGIEHTEAVPTNVAHAASIRASNGDLRPYFIRSASPEEPVRPRTELIAEIEEDRPPPPMMGDSVERGWVNAMVHFIRKKMASATKPGYAACVEHWLLIYDNWPAPALQHEHALQLLDEQPLTENSFSVFTRVFIVDEQVLIELRRELTLIHRINYCRPRC